MLNIGGKQPRATDLYPFRLYGALALNAQRDKGPLETIWLSAFVC